MRYYALLTWRRNLFHTLIIALSLHACCGQQLWNRWKRQLPPLEWNPWRSPLERFDKYVFSRKLDAYGEFVKGFSIPMYLEDTFWDINWGEYPQWYLRRINCFLGVPYAEPPVGRYRFQRPLPPRWVGTWDATSYRPACPQKIENLQQDIPTIQKVNISEDCLYMNIFVPNRTAPNLEFDKKIYPVIVYIHSGNFSTGTSQSQPGHVLATRDVVVVTFNYRLGALGFLTTEDEHSPGNFGMWDQIQALEFVKRNIVAFRGDPNRITIMGEGAGGVSVGLHLVSPASYRNAFFNQAIMMSGTDLSMFGMGRPFYRPRIYAQKLAKAVGCNAEESYSMIRCLRNNASITWEMIVEAQHRIEPNDGILGAVWAPIQDGLFYSIPTEGFLPESPDDYRREGQFAKVPCIIGINAHDGAEIANRTMNGLQKGLSTSEFRKYLDDLMVRWKVIDVYRERARDAVEFQYTHWPDPTNATARGQEFLNMITDLNYGIGMDRIVKQQSEWAPTYMYVFNWKSWNDWLPWYMGVSHSSAVQYVLGFPFLNETILNETEMVPKQYFDYDDRNISDFMMYMWSSFAIYGEPTPNITRNVTWETFNDYNFTYLEVRWYAHLWFRYRQSQYGFWNEYFPKMAKQDYFYPTATPTPAAYEYVVSTGCVGSLLVLLLGAVAIVLYLMWYQNKAMKDAKYQHQGYHFKDRKLYAQEVQKSKSREFMDSEGSDNEVVSSPMYSSSNVSRMTAAQYSEHCKRTAPISHSSKNKKKGGKVVDASPLEGMKPAQIMDHMVRIRAELETERKERDHFMQERDRIAASLEVVKSRLDLKEKENRNIIYDMEKLQETHNFEIKVMKQKIKYLMFENQKKIEEIVNENNQAMKAIQDESRIELMQLRTELKNFRTQLKSEQAAHELSVKNLKVKHADDMANIQQDFERRVLEIETKYKNKIAAREADNDLKFRNELHEVEERKNFEIFSLMQTHDRLYKDMKDYYNDLVLNGINLINGLKVECENLRKKDELLEKKMSDMTSESKQSSQKMVDMTKMQKDNASKLKRLTHVKYMLREKDCKLKSVEDVVLRQEKEIEVLNQIKTTIKAERDELYKNFVTAIHEIQERAGIKNCFLEIKLESMKKEMELVSTHLDETIRHFKLDPNAVQALTRSIESTLELKNKTIQELQYELARVCKAHNDLMNTYESRLKLFKIPPDETGFFPVKTVVINDSALGEGAAGLVSKNV